MEDNVIKISKSRIYGEIDVSGAKNSALRLLAASLLTQDKLVLHNFPNSLLDVEIHISMLEKLGKVCITKNDTIIILEKEKNITELIWESRSIRNTLLILGALIARYGRGKVPLPGGCNLGDRKYDLHIMILKSMGADIWEEGNYLCGEVNGKLSGSEINLPIRSTGATENAIIIGSLAKGKTILWNPHIRPEIVDLINMLNKMGARIEVFGQKCIIIDGVDNLNGVEYSVIPDNMEAITWAIAAGITNGELEIKKFPSFHLEVPLIFLRESGMKIFYGENSTIIKGKNVFPIEISTGPYPGINSDMQPLFAVFGACSEGESRIIDLRFPGRYGYIDELAKMGLKYEIIGDLLKIFGGKKLKGTKVKALDLRCGISLWLAGIVAEDQTVISDAWQIFRGYDKFEDKVKKICQKI